MYKCHVPSLFGASDDVSCLGTAELQGLTAQAKYPPRAAPAKRRASPARFVVAWHWQATCDANVAGRIGVIWKPIGGPMVYEHLPAEDRTQMAIMDMGVCLKIW